jgi:ribonuclease HI
VTVARDFREVDFRRYLMEAGVAFVPVTNEYEVIRYRRNGQCGIVYRNAKGRITLTGDAEVMWRALTDGHPPTEPLPEQNAPRRRVQLFTDASNYHATKAGAWAAILVLPDDSAHEAHGQLRGDIGSSTSAEARAVANGLHHFLRLGLIRPRDVITVVCDNRAVCDRLGTQKRSKQPEVQQALAAIHKLASSHALKIAGDWVKGHQAAHASRADPRVTFNRRCDALCSAHGKALNRERCAPSRARVTREEAAA